MENNMPFEAKIEHKLNNLNTAIKGLYANSEQQELQIKAILESVNEITKSVGALTRKLDDVAIKVDGNDELDVVGLRRRVQYLESRDKWLKNKWMYAVGAAGGITIVYYVFKAIEFVFTLYKNITNTPH
jgi:hypothetical protein